MTPPDEFRALLRRGKLTRAAAADLVGVNPRTVGRWLAGDSEIPYSAMSLIQAHVEQEDSVAEFSAADAVLESAPAMTAAEQVIALRAIQTMQHQMVCEAEDDLAQLRRELAETTQRMNALASQC